MNRYYLIYLGVISVVSVVVCIYDKIAAKHNPKHRTQETTLLALSALGGSVAMLLCMLLIRHKTKHLKFMIGIPVMLALQICLYLTVLHPQFGC